MGKTERIFETKLPGDTPEMGDAPLPVEPYVSREYFERERESVFKRAWLEVAREEEIPSPGDYLTIELEVLKASIVLVRGDDNQLRAFHNICTHRGNKIALEKQGNTKGFTCGFHGWAFGLDGELEFMAGEEYFTGGPKKCDLGLIPVTLDTWKGFVFIHAMEQPPQSLEEYLGGMGQQLNPFPHDECEHIARYSATPKVNWKVAIDAFQEAFHAITVHRESLPGAAASNLNPGAALTSARFYGPHRSLSAWLNLEYLPPEVGLMVGKYGPAFVTSHEDYPGINPNNDESWWFDINVIFPNFFCDVGPGWYFTYNFWPISENETRWVMDIYQIKAKNAGELLAQEHTKVLLRDAVLEDFITLEDTQAMMESGALKQVMISDLEIAVRHQMWIVNQWLSA
ncbi:MAG: aromatic ring-hydroxylating dioxygenase subunit alpha [Gammaproteobacteria bacterium]